MPDVAGLGVCAETQRRFQSCALKSLVREAVGEPICFLKW